MSDDYTTYEVRKVGTQFVREGYIHSGDLHPAAYRIMGIEFDRWLAGYTRAAQEAAWDHCLDEIETNELNTDQARQGNPYRTSPSTTRPTNKKENR